jgi:hypothetical protein
MKSHYCLAKQRKTFAAKKALAAGMVIVSGKLLAGLSRGEAGDLTVLLPGSKPI